MQARARRPKSREDRHRETMAERFERAMTDISMNSKIDEITKIGVSGKE
jgi:hypothetical protein